MWPALLAIALMLCAATARAEPLQRPLPVPQRGAGCPPGYSSSPTSGMCVPSAGTKAKAVPQVGVGCPAGYSSSPTSGMCVETRR
jgi:hypothetical protein